MLTMFGSFVFFLLTSLLAGTFRVVSSQEVVDPCSTYSFAYMYDKRRSTDYKTVIDVDRPICDWSQNTIDRWVRFDHEVGTRLRESCVPIYRCGTQMPIWMNGRHPEDDEIVEREVCANYYNGSCCDWSETIQVKKCADFFVYKLANPNGCSIAYCVDGDSHKDCPFGYLWSLDFQYCYENGTNPSPPSPTTTTTTTTPTPKPKPNPNATQPALPLTTTPVSTPPSPASWRPWGNWGPCSKTCDHGQRVRMRYCQQPPCFGAPYETEPCAFLRCPELDTEKYTGITVILELYVTKWSLWATLVSTASVTDTMQKVVENEEHLLDIWRRSINAECKMDASICCQKNVSSSTTNDFLASSDIWTASGYPQQYRGNNAVALMFVAVINPKVDMNICQRPGGSGPTYVVPSVLQAAVNKSVDDIALVTGLTVVGSTITTLPTTTKPHDKPKRETWHSVLIGVGAAVMGVVVGVVVSLIVHCLKLHGRVQQQQQQQPPPDYEESVKPRDVDDADRPDQNFEFAAGK